jgi:hypothetical protein
MPSYHEALPICEAAMDVAVLVDAVVQCLAKGPRRSRETAFDLVVNVKRRLAHLSERPMAHES